MPTPKISVIVPVYNSEKFLRKSLDSIRFQTYSNLEIICVDDESTDNSLEILKEYLKALLLTILKTGLAKLSSRLINVAM